jgi:ACR3 family arsenite transporter
VLVEVPVMLSLVAFANRTQGWLPASVTGDVPRGGS